MTPDEPKGPSEERHEGDGELALSFNSPVSEDDKLLLEALGIAIYGPQARLEVDQGVSDKEVIIRGNQSHLRRISDALSNREWETNREMQSRIDSYVWVKKHAKRKEQGE